LEKVTTEYEEMVAGGIPQDDYLLVRLSNLTIMIPTLTSCTSFMKLISNPNVGYSRFVLTYPGREISTDGLAACKATV